MERNNVLKNTINAMPTNQIFEASNLYFEQCNSNMSEAAFYKALERMVKEGELIKLSKGLYARAKKSKYGVVLPSEEEIIANYIGSNNGMVIGYPLYNLLNISTQIAKIIRLYSNSINQQTKTIRNIFIERKEIKFTDEVCRVIEMLEILSNFNAIQELNYNAFIGLCEKFYRQYNEETTDYVLENINYSKSTIAFLQNILRYYGVKNSLAKHLSAFSKYNYPSMEKINELARI